MLDKDTALSWLHAAASALNKPLDNIVSVPYDNDAPAESDEGRKERRRSAAIQKMFDKETFGHTDEAYKRDYGEDALPINDFMRAIDSVQKHVYLKEADPNYKPGEGVFALNTQDGILKGIGRLGGKIANRMVFATNTMGNEAELFLRKNVAAPLEHFGDYLAAARGMSSTGTPASLADYRKAGEEQFTYSPFFYSAGKTKEEIAANFKNNVSNNRYGTGNKWIDALQAAAPTGVMLTAAAPVFKLLTSAGSAAGSMAASAVGAPQWLGKLVGGGAGLGAGMLQYGYNPVDQAATNWGSMVSNNQGYGKIRDPQFGNMVINDLSKDLGGHWSELEDKDTWFRSIDK